MNADLDLELHRVIRAPRSAVWRAWTDPDELRQWFIPAPTMLRVETLDVQPGGALVTSLSDDGETYHPHIDAVFIVVEPGHRLVWTNAIDSEWRPQHPQPVALTAEILLLDHEQGTDYRVVVRHGNPDDRLHHVELGFFEGWGSVTDQLAGFVEQTVTMTDGSAHTPHEHVPADGEATVPELEVDETVAPRPEEAIADVARAEPDVEDHAAPADS